MLPFPTCDHSFTLPNCCLKRQDIRGWEEQGTSWKGRAVAVPVTSGGSQHTQICTAISGKHPITAPWVTATESFRAHCSGAQGDGKKTMKQTFRIQRPESILAVSTWFWSPSVCNLHGGSSECHHRGMHWLYFAAQLAYPCTEAQTLCSDSHTVQHTAEFTHSFASEWLLWFLLQIQRIPQSSVYAEYLPLVAAADPRAGFLNEDFIQMYIPAQQHCYTVIPEQVMASHPAEYSDRKMLAVCVRPTFPVPAPVGSVVKQH